LLNLGALPDKQIFSGILLPTKIRISDRSPPLDLVQMQSRKKSNHGEGAFAPPGLPRKIIIIAELVDADNRRRGIFRRIIVSATFLCQTVREAKFKLDKIILGDFAVY